MVSIDSLTSPSDLLGDCENFASLAALLVTRGAWAGRDDGWQDLPLGLGGGGELEPVQLLQQPGVVAEEAQHAVLGQPASTRHNQLLRTAGAGVLAQGGYYILTCLLALFSSTINKLLDN